MQHPTPAFAPAFFIDSSAKLITFRPMAVCNRALHPLPTIAGNAITGSVRPGFI